MQSRHALMHERLHRHPSREQQWSPKTMLCQKTCVVLLLPALCAWPQQVASVPNKAEDCLVNIQPLLTQDPAVPLRPKLEISQQAAGSSKTVSKLLRLTIQKVCHCIYLLKSSIRLPQSPS